MEFILIKVGFEHFSNAEAERDGIRIVGVVEVGAAAAADTTEDLTVVGKRGTLLPVISSIANADLAVDTTIVDINGRDLICNIRAVGNKTCNGCNVRSFQSLTGVVVTGEAASRPLHLPPRPRHSHLLLELYRT